MRENRRPTPTCESCGSHIATTRRGGSAVGGGERVDLCAPCAHMVDQHHAGVWDAYMPDPCHLEEEAR